MCSCPNGYVAIEDVHVAEANAPTEMQQPQHAKRARNRPAFPLQPITLDLNGMSGASAGFCLKECDWAASASLLISRPCTYSRM